MSFTTDESHPADTSSRADSLGQAPTPPRPATSVLSAYPHLGHYIFNLLANLPSPSRAPSQTHHPLSVSSSSESDDDEPATKTLDNEHKTPQKAEGPSVGSTSEKEGLVRRVVELLDREDEDGVKMALQGVLGELGKVGPSSQPGLIDRMRFF